MDVRFALIAFLIVLQVQQSLAVLEINKIVPRTPKLDDIGLIFDLSVVNSENEKKEMLEYRVRALAGCTVNISETETMCDVGKIVGGNFGNIESGAVDTVSLVWPTVSVFNRVGYCPIVIISTDVRGEKKEIKHELHFDTRIPTLDPDGRTLRKHKDYKDCENWDKEYFMNCTPVDCEERYFGRRNFYNSTSEHCEVVPLCIKPGEVYDFYANECLDTEHFVSEEDLDNIRKGKYDENYLDLKCNYGNNPDLVVNDDDADMVQFRSSSFQDDFPDAHEIPKRDTETVAETSSNNKEDTSSIPYWLRGLADGLLIVNNLYWKIFN